MSITDENTVFIVGAGTSAPFDLALGGDLISQIANAITTEQKSITRINQEHYGATTQIITDAIHTPNGFARHPIHGAVLHDSWDKNEKRWKEGSDEEFEKIKHLKDLLTSQTSETIDDFIVENPGYANIAKKCIAALFSCHVVMSRTALK